MLLYPGNDSKNVSAGEFLPKDLGDKQLVVFLLDGTWACAKKMMKLSVNLHPLTRLMFTPTKPSEFHIKQQPDEICLSTIESIHQFLEALEGVGIEEKKDWKSLLNPFMAMQRYQIEASQDPTRHRYRKGGFKPPGQRKRMRVERSRKLFF